VHDADGESGAFRIVRFAADEWMRPSELCAFTYPRTRLDPTQISVEDQKRRYFLLRDAACDQAVTAAWKLAKEEEDRLRLQQGPAETRALNI
jgi:hypothetical protein